MNKAVLPLSLAFGFACVPGLAQAQTTPSSLTDSDGDGIKDACDIDSDGDGIDDAIDNCINTPNFDQANCDDDAFGTGKP